VRTACTHIHKHRSASNDMAWRRGKDRWGSGPYFGHSLEELI
jgi:hypothetical protein